MSANWTYKVIDVKPKSMLGTLNAEYMQDILNQQGMQGMQGWELVDVVQLAVNQASLYFKKHK